MRTALLLAGFLAKVQFPTDRDQNIVVLLTLGIGGALVGGFVTHMALHPGPSWAGHIAAFVASVLALVIHRSATQPRFA